jgi:hypothetical protein
MKQEPKSIFTSKTSFTRPHDQERASNSQPSQSRRNTRSQSPATTSFDVDGETEDTHQIILEGISNGQCKDRPAEGAPLTGAFDVGYTIPNDLLQRQPPQSNPPSGGLHTSTTPSPAKRSLTETFGPRSELSSKRPRHRIRLGRTLDLAALPTGLSANISSPTSPLFFSHTARHIPALPSTFSSSQSAATMLNRSREESSVTTTLMLARGSISSASPPRVSSTPGSWKSLGRGGSMPRSPALEADSSTLQVFNAVGIVDLLEQDERPTFVIDLADATNFSPGPIQVIYVNPSLQASDKILEMVLGTMDLNSPGVAVTAFPEFKAWALSFVKNNESLDVCLPSFLYGGVTWTCSTLKKKLRVISGITGMLAPRQTGSGSTPGSTFGLPQTIKQKSTNSPLKGIVEPADYFGEAANNPSGYSSPALNENPMVDNMESFVPPDEPTLEHPHSAYLTLAEKISLYDGNKSSFDWTRLPISSSLPRHIQFARSIDWASTSLGPIESWSFDLRAMCNLVMGSPHPAAMCESSITYNHSI